MASNAGYAGQFSLRVSGWRESLAAWLSFWSLGSDAMRILGYFLIVFGFLWVCFWQLEIQPIARATVLHHYDLLPKQELYSPDEVREAMRDTAYDFSEHIRQFYIGAVLMLAGGVIIDHGRHKRISK